MTLHKLKTVAVLAAGATALAAAAGVRLDTPAPALAAPAPPPKPTVVAGSDVTANVLRPTDDLNLRLLRSDVIRKDLGLTDDEVATVSDAVAKVDGAFKEKMTTRFGGGGGVIRVQGVPAGGAIPPLPPGGGGAVIPVQGVPALPAGGAIPIPPGGRVAFGAASKGITSDDLYDEFFGPKSAFAKAVTPLLTDARAKRLRQLDLAATGPAAFSNRRVVRLLALTEAQEDEIEAIQKQFRTDTRETRFDPVKQGELQDAAVAACVKRLTPDQKDLWTACVGPTVPAAELLTAMQSQAPIGPGK